MYSANGSMKLSGLSKALCRTLVCCLTAVTALTSAPSAHASKANIRSINGVEPGERVSGDVFVWARSTGDVSEVIYELTGPANIEVKRSGHFSYFMLNDDGKGASWDTTTVPDGVYRLRVFSLFNGEVYRSKDLQFTVDNISPEAEAALAAAKQDEDIEPAVTEEAEVEEEVIEPSRIEESEGVKIQEQPSDTEQVAVVGSDQPVLKPADVFSVGFASLGSSYRKGSGQKVLLNVTREPGANEDVLVLAWSVAESRVVSEFTFPISAAPWEIPASKMDLLPEGKVNLQLLIRKDGNKINKIAQSTEVLAPLPEISLASIEGFTIGKAESVPVQLSGDLPDGYQLYALARSAEDQQVASGFEHELNSSNPVIDAGRLNTLSAGAFDLVVQMRDGASVVKAASRRVQVMEEQVEIPIVVEPDPIPVPEPVSSGDPAARFVDAPGSYLPGSGQPIRFEVENLPAGGDVLIIAWSDALGSLVGGFGHSPDAGPWQIDASKLDLLPAGKVELQLIIRGGDTRPKTVHRMEVVGQTADGGPSISPTPGGEAPPVQQEDPPAGTTIDPAPAEAPPVTSTDPDPEPVDDPPTGPSNGSEPDSSGDPDPGFTGPAEGFTELAKTAETVVIYVSSSQGNDNNDGRSEAKPVKTLAKAAKLIQRWGKPDWLLLKAGDTWNGETLEVDVSGGGEGKEDLIGVYGDGPRPLIIPPNGAHGIKIINNQINGLVIQGLHIYAATRDPGSSQFVSRNNEADGINLRLTGSEGQYAKHFVIEDCKISHFDTNMEIVDDYPRIHLGEGVPGRIEVTIRRNIVRYASGDDSHSVGIYLEGLKDSVVEQNLIDHNGWAQTDAKSHRNKRSHNIYAQSFNGPMAIRHNILTRGAANGLQLRAGGDVEHNLFARNALAFWMSINDSKANYNVILESDDMDPNDSNKHRGIGIQGWSMDYYEVIGNVIARREGSLLRPAVELHAGTLVVKNNKIYKWENTSKDMSLQLNSPDLTNTGNLSQEAFGGQEPPFIDPERGVEEYAAKIGLDATLEAFIDAASKRPRGQWVDEYDPATICRYIRNGFDLIPHD